MSSAPSASPHPGAPPWQHDAVRDGQRPAFPGTEYLKAAEIFSGPGYQAPRSSTDPVAVIALVLSVLSVVPGVGLLAAAAGTWALRRLRRRWMSGLGMAWFAVVVGCASSVAWLWMWWFLLETWS